MLRLRGLPPRALAWALVLALVGGARPMSRTGAPAPVPPIVFVSRQPLRGEPGAIPGLGPHHRAAAPGGRLLVRERDGRVRSLLPAGVLFDVADPAVSFDGRWIAFAGTPHADSAWRIYRVAADGSRLTPWTHGDRTLDLGPLGPGAGRFARYDDLDPCWLDSHTLCFASTRYPQRSQYADLPVTNLFVVTLGGRPQRITAERNGAEEPCLDPTTGRVVFTRWWFNRHRPSRSDPRGFTAAHAEGADSVNLWQAVEITRAGRDERLAGGDLRSRRGAMVYQPAVLRDGTLLGVFAANLGCSPRPGATGIHRFAGRFGAARHLAGAIVAETAGDAYSGARGLAAPSACAPAALPDGRVAFAYDPGARGDFGLYVMRNDGTAIERLVNLPGTLELDPAPLVPRETPRRFAAAKGAGAAHRPSLLPPLSLSGLAAERGSFRYRCLNVFASGPLDHPSRTAPPPVGGARIRFFAALARPEREGGDSIALVREAPLGPDGSVDQMLPADVPLFEQVVDAGGRVLISAHGSAHVAGFNAGGPGSTSRCIGCHTGHSTLIRGRLEADAAWFNAAPGAEVRASSSEPGSSPRMAVDRRVRGRRSEVAWVASGGESEWLELKWAGPLQVRAVELYGIQRDRAQGVQPGYDLRLFFEGREVTRKVAGSAPGLRGTRIPIPGVVADQIVIRFGSGARPATGQIAALGEIAVQARLPSRR
ncbi:MAG TPA: hypothetical protein VEY91_05850 [Candidatus Limnocylindria bacterium]|nr:hypothetical protein [Candidatus Limnocylindria bacterium]